MTGDESLATPAQLCLNYFSYAQNPDGGGWQYSPRVGGDTSVVGWQLMALKSGAMGGLEINPITLRKAAYFLDSVQMNDGAFYGYDKPECFDRWTVGNERLWTSVPNVHGLAEDPSGHDRRDRLSE